MIYTINMVKPNKERIEVEWVDGKEDAKESIDRLINEYKADESRYFTKVVATNERGKVCFSKHIYLIDQLLNSI